MPSVPVPMLVLLALVVTAAGFIRGFAEWRRIAGFRDVLAHGYFGLDDDILSDVISNKVPEVQKAVEIALDATE